MNKIIFKMAAKNLFANKAKMIITLSLIGIGTFLIILGLGVLNFAVKQTEAVCISDFSGDILIHGKHEDEKVGVELLGTYMVVSTTPNRPEMPYLLPFETIKAKLESMSEVKVFSSSIVSSGMFEPVDLPDDWEVKEENKGSFPFLRYLGIIPENYKTVFDTIKIYEGEFPQGGSGNAADTGFIMIPRKAKEKFEKYYERELKIGDEILLSSFGAKSRRQKIFVKGFFDYAHPDTAIENIAYIDVNSCRILANMTLGAKTASEIPDSIDLTLSEKSEDELFGEDEAVVSVLESTNEKIDYENILGSTELRDSLNLADNDAWHHITLKLTNPANTQTVIADLNKWFEEENINAKAVDWTGGMASYYIAIKSARTLFITMLVILAVVVLVVIMNTLVVSVMQRNSEIGTMRAIGARKGFVRKIFYAESFFMSLVGVLIGLALATIAAVIINSLDIRVGTVLSRMLGGKQIRVSISAVSVLWTMLAMLMAGLAANWYPVRLALKISPLEAINR